jgi:hypothetical protein
MNEHIQKLMIVQPDVVVGVIQLNVEWPIPILAPALKVECLDDAMHRDGILLVSSLTRRSDIELDEELPRHDDLSAHKRLAERLPPGRQLVDLRQRKLKEIAIRAFRREVLEPDWVLLASCPVDPRDALGLLNEHSAEEVARSPP